MMACQSNSGFYDYVLIGCGGIGSATVFWLSKRAEQTGERVLALEQFKLGHDNGGSQDVSRIIRLSYHQDVYTALARGAYKAWEETEKESGEPLVFKTGGLNIGIKGTVTEEVVRLYASSMEKQGVTYEILEGKELKKRYPQFTAPNLTAVYQKDSGLVDAARGNSTHIQLAVAHGATVLENAAVARIERLSNGTVKVFSNKGIFTCRRVIVTAGAWINNVLRSVGLQLPLTVTQEQVTYFRTPHVKDCSKTRFPIFMFHLPTFDIYGLPSHGNTYSKIGVDAAMSPIVTAESRNFTPDPKREQYCVDFLKETIPKFLGPIAYTKTCLYTMTPDRDFVIDTCAKFNFPEVIFCCGAGHAYKFAGVLGRILTDLAVDGETTFDIAPFKLDRPALMDPTYKTDFHIRSGLKAKPSQSKL